MSEIEYQAQAFIVDYKCDKCGEGSMLYTGYSNPTNPPLYQHKCTKCDATDKFRGKTYPYTYHKRGDAAK